MDTSSAGLGGNDIQKLTSAFRGSKNGVVRVLGAALWVPIDSQNRSLTPAIMALFGFLYPENDAICFSTPSWAAFAS